MCGVAAQNGGGAPGGSDGCASIAYPSLSLPLVAVVGTGARGKGDADGGGDRQAYR